MSARISSGNECSTILDTSAWNALLNDIRHHDLVHVLSKEVVWPTTLAISEICATPEESRRLALLRLVKSVGGNRRPLNSPNQLITQACNAYARREPDIDVTNGDEVEGAWIALNDPARVDSEAQKIAKKFNDEREQIFRQWNERLRKDLQEIFKRGTKRPPSLGALIKRYNSNNDFLYEVVNLIYERSVGSPLPGNEIRTLIQSLRIWPMFLIGYACAIYQRAVKEQGFGHKHNPGNLDLWSATYLPFCGRFITDDKRQRRALRVINKYNTCPAQIISYIEWKNSHFSS